jgi:hypothetical protein
MYVFAMDDESCCDGIATPFPGCFLLWVAVGPKCQSLFGFNFGNDRHLQPLVGSLWVVLAHVLHKGRFMCITVHMLIAMTQTLRVRI